MKNITFLIIITLISSLTTAKAQTAEGNKMVVYYPFEGVKSENEIAILDQEIKKMMNVSDSKTEYKAGKTNAQLQVWVTYPAVMLENEKFFSTVLLKQLLLQKGYKPLQPKEVRLPLDK
ncbi:MAG: hypothetical protein H7331_12220 [Bacteroidia bacterium]|nr:hypothetical protein [Bacteroidia bacterium]